MTPLNVDVPAAEQDVDSLTDAIEKAVWFGIYGVDAVKLFLDEMQIFLTHRAFEVALTLFLGTAGNSCARLAESKAGGAELLGHR